MQLRDYQLKLKHDIYESWRAKFLNVLAVLPTGGGKTAIKADIFHECQTASCAIAHRQELVGQISTAMARAGVVHRIIAPDAVIAFCIKEHIELFGRSFHHRNAPVGVAGVDTLLRRTDMLKQWLSQIGIWDIDEAHHVLTDNKWGKAVNLFKNAYGLGLTATPTRCDRKSLGRKNKTGVFDKLVTGPGMRELITRGYLSEYEVYGPPASYTMDESDISKSTGEFSSDKVKLKARKSTVIGDTVEHYLRIAPGKRGITFTPDVDQARQTAEAFRQKGVPAEAISAETPDHVRKRNIQKFVRGEILELVNVDLFGEGFDVPACEVVSMDRATNSYALYSQQFGRCLRTADGKKAGIVIDHVNNVKRHKLPDRKQFWSLDDVENVRRKKADDDGIPVTSCTKCFRSYEKLTNKCPYCGHVEVPAVRSSPEHVDGDLELYGPELLAELRGEINRINGGAQIPYGASSVVEYSVKNKWEERQQAHQHLRECIALWAGIERDIHHRTDSESYRRFYFKFGIDVLTAQTLNTSDALKLAQQVRETFT